MRFRNALIKNVLARGVLVNSAADNVLFENVEFDNTEKNGIGTAVECIGTWASDAYLTFRNCKFKGFYNNGYAGLTNRIATQANLPTWGTTENRPVSPPIGWFYFDTTLGKPIFFKTGTTWVDANGITV